jgi:hypothetical protein
VSLCLLLLSGCASVPKETVALSVAVGEDIQQLYSGYKSMVRFSFDQMRTNGLLVIDEIWMPVYLATFVREGELLEIAREENWADLEGWARAAIEDIEAKRREFVDSVDTRETALLEKIDQAFERTISANAAVTAHLNSVLKVEGLQDQVLDAVDLKDLRDQITNGITEASNFAADAAEKIRAASAALDETVNNPG